MSFNCQRQTAEVMAPPCTFEQGKKGGGNVCKLVNSPRVILSISMLALSVACVASD
jgi:hypothetical protein